MTKWLNPKKFHPPINRPFLASIRDNTSTKSKILYAFISKDNPEYFTAHLYYIDYLILQSRYDYFELNIDEINRWAELPEPPND